MINFLFITFITLPPFIGNNPNSSTYNGGNEVLVTSSQDPENIFQVYSKNDPQFAPLRIVTLIGENSINYDKDFAYLAAIPMGLYKENNILKVSPILYDDLSLAEENFLIDWKSYCSMFDSWDGIKNIVYIGNVSEETKTYAEDLLNPEMLHNLYLPAQQRERVQLSGQNTFDLAAQIATYFWYQPETAILAVINETFPVDQTNLLSYSNTILGNTVQNVGGEINGTYLENYWSNANISLNTGGIYIEIDNVADLAMELYGNFTDTAPWMYDTNKITKNNWVFFPNVSYPADMADWGLKIYNTTPATPFIPYTLNFYDLSYQTYQFQIDNSECNFEIFLNWTNPTDDLNFWVLDPSKQLISASSRWGNIYQTGNTNKTSSLLYPEKGTWTIIITRPTGISPIFYDLTINITTFSAYRRQCIESASNGAVIASLLNKPLLYVTNETIPEETKSAIGTLNLSSVVLVDPFNLMSQGIFDELSTLNISLSAATNLTSQNFLYEYIYNQTQQPDIILSSVNGGYFGPASLLAAFHGAPVLFSLSENYNIHAGALKNYAIENWVGFQNPGNSALLNQSIPRYEEMKNLADIFYSWLNTMNLDKIGNETVLVVSPLWELNPLFDRSIYGKAFVGRFIGEDDGDLATFICRNILYPALSYSNISYDYTINTKLSSISGIGTKTYIQPQHVAPYSGIYTDCQADDSVYHSFYLRNDATGLVAMAYYVNLSQSQMIFNNISQVGITIDGKISYSNSSILTAGWGIWNWSAGSYKILNTRSLNSTADQSDTIYITEINKTNFIYSPNSRIELFILINTTGSPLNVSIDFLQFNITYAHIRNSPSMLSSSITYWHNFEFQGQTYNYSSLIPTNFTMNGYQVINATGYQEIYSSLAENCKFWYYSGNSTLPESRIGAQGNMLFTDTNYWRSFGDQDDTQGATPDNPDADGDHLVTANSTLEKWQTGTELNMSLPSLHSTFVILQSSYLGVTKIPEYLMDHGATIVIADMKQTELGYSEHFSYVTMTKLLENKPVGEALLNAFNQTSHLYSQNWKGNIGSSGSYFPEENQQFILFGDPELNLINQTFNLIHPNSYRPLIHGFKNYAYRSGDAGIHVYPSFIWVNLTDIDSYWKKTVFIQNDVFVRFNITGTTYGRPGEPFHDAQFNQSAIYRESVNLFMGETIFHDLYLDLWEDLDENTINWIITDESNEIRIDSNFLLRSFPPMISEIGISLNDTGVYNTLQHTSHERIGRVNESIFLSLKITDADQNLTADADEFKVNVTLTNTLMNYSLSFRMNFKDDWNSANETSLWNYTYHFSEYDPSGRYDISFRAEDMFGEIYQISNYDYIYVINWIPEKNGTNFVTTNGTGANRQVYRMNETIEVNAAVFDLDGDQMRVQNVSLCFYQATNRWINLTMADPDSNNIWTAIYNFTKFNKTGTWFPYIKVTDKDNATVLLKPNTNITVANHPPDATTNLAMKNLTQFEVTSILRNTTIQLLANATDLDAAYPISNLTLYACLKAPNGAIIYQKKMTYNNNSKQWIYNFTPAVTDAIGNWTYYVSVWDEVNAHTNSSIKLFLKIQNNIPLINTVNVNPTGGILNFGEPLRISGAVSDIEGLSYIRVNIIDEKGKTINLTQSLTGTTSLFNIQFNEASYENLTDGTWNITIQLYDKDGNFTGDFSFDSQNNLISITVRPAIDENPKRFPYEIIIIVAIVVTTVLATFLVYRTRKKEETVIPAARVKQIIKKISRTSEEEIEEARADIKARIKAVEVPSKKAEMPVVPIKTELTEEDKQELNQKLQDLVKEAQRLYDENEFETAALAYHDAAKIASKLEKYEIARVYSDKGEEILLQKDLLKKEAKVKAKEEKKELKKKKVERTLSKNEIESIKSEIGEIMRSARKAIREEDYMTAAKLYQEVAGLYRKILDEEKAEYFEQKAAELL